MEALQTEQMITDKDQQVSAIVPFLSEIGIDCVYGSVPADSFVPGIRLEKGKLVIDPGKLEYPGDLLHEAGHLAALLPEERNLLAGNADLGQPAQNSLEMAAICWSYAALVHLKLDPGVVFHAAGYRGASSWYIENFTSGNYIGLPLLQWMGMCKLPQDESDTPPFPHMISWLRVPAS
jgi:hypothetical protein